MKYAADKHIVNTAPDPVNINNNDRNNDDIVNDVEDSDVVDPNGEHIHDNDTVAVAYIASLPIADSNTNNAAVIWDSDSFSDPYTSTSITGIDDNNLIHDKNNLDLTEKESPHCPLNKVEVDLMKISIILE